jgi:hypothetical protein
VGWKLRPGHFLGLGIRHLIEHKLRGNPAHSLQHVAQARTDFQFARLNSSNRFAGKHSVLEFRMNERSARPRSTKTRRREAFFVDGMPMSHSFVYRLFATRSFLSGKVCQFRLSQNRGSYSYKPLMHSSQRKRELFERQLPGPRRVTSVTMEEPHCSCCLIQLA